MSNIPPRLAVPIRNALPDGTVTAQKFLILNLRELLYGPLRELMSSKSARASVWGPAQEESFQASI